MSHFCLLRNPEAYRPVDWNLLADDAARAHWLDHFERQFESTLEHAVRQYGKAASPQIEEARKEFAARIESLRRNSDIHGNGTFTVLDLDRIREGILHGHSLHDPYRKAKNQANLDALQIYPEFTRSLHAMPDDEKWLYLAESMLAGNIFDLGAEATMQLRPDADAFFDALDDLKPRPWLIDDFDRLEADLMLSLPAKWTKAVIFLDNAGPDFVLGVMSLARELALAGVMVVLAANEGAALNDMTVDETIDMIQRIAAIDGDLRAMIDAQMLEVASTGSGVPLLDLSNVSDELNEAAADADLVIFEGMGRALESNFDVELTVDCLQIAAIKDSAVAKRYNGELYDLVCRYRPITTA